MCDGDIIIPHQRWRSMESSLQDDEQRTLRATVMFFGLTNSPATFQTMMDATFRNEIATGDVVIYMDDILIATAGSLDQHRRQVHHVLQKLQDNDLFLKPEKCCFPPQGRDYPRSNWLGKDKSRWIRSKSKESLTGLHLQISMSFAHSLLWELLQRFHSIYSHITRPLHELTKKNASWCWDETQSAASNS